MIDGDDEPQTHPEPPARRAVFIGLDSALLERSRPNGDALRLARGAPDALSALQRGGFALVVVTHESGLALGYVSRSELTLLEVLLRRLLRAEAGVDLTDFMVCPHRPGTNGGPGCLCRAPAPGLLIRAARAHRLELAASWMVGDSLDDIEAGRRGGCRTALLREHDAEAPQRLSPLRLPHCRCSAWDQVAHELLAPHRGDAAVRHIGAHAEPRNAGFG
jgi:D-glycero-D-manno-heptose 1,7-bisphosphate phosphatase